MANTLSVRKTSPPNPLDLNPVRITGREKTIRYTCTLSGSYVQHIRGQNVGEVLDLTKVIGRGDSIPEQFWMSNGPSAFYVLNTGGTGFSMSIVPGADAFHWLLCIFSGVSTELAAGLYSANAAGLLTDVDIILEANGRNFD